MTKKGNYTQVKTIRITKEQEDKLEDLGVSIREAIEYYILNNTNELKKLKNREKYLLNEIPIKEKELNTLKNELKEVRVKLGQNPEENPSNIEVILAGNRILENCKITNDGKVDINTLANYMMSKKAKNILNNIVNEYSIKDKEIFKKKVSDYLKL